MENKGIINNQNVEYVCPKVKAFEVKIQSPIADSPNGGGGDLEVPGEGGDD